MPTNIGGFAAAMMLAVIGIFGQAPIEFKLTDPTKPKSKTAANRQYS